MTVAFNTPEDHQLPVCCGLFFVIQILFLAHCQAIRNERLKFMLHGLDERKHLSCADVRGSSWKRHLKFGVWS